MSPTASDPRTVVTDMWQTRPTRRQTDRKIAVVAAALARRYDVDPVLMRIAFVVSAFCGVGILLYLAAWVALPPDFNDPPTGGAQTSQVTRVLVYVALVLVSLHAIHGLAGGEVDFLVGLLVVGGLLYLLQVTRGEHRPDLAYSAGQPGSPGVVHPDSGGAVQPGSGTAAGADATPGADAARPGGAGAARPGGAGAARLGGAGAAPASAFGPTSVFGPPAPVVAPGPVMPPGPRVPRSRVTPVTLALALLAAGITGVVMLSGHSTFPGSRAVVAVPLAVIGIGLLVGSFTRGGRGLVPIALPLVLVGFVLNWAPTQHWRGAGDLRFVPSSVSTLAPRYEQSFGDVELDLRRLDLAAPGSPASVGAPTPGGTVPSPVGAAPPAGGTLPTPGTATPTGSPAAAAVGEPIRTQVTLQVGEALVLVPPNADVRVHCHASIGEVDCLGDPGARYGATEDGGPTADAVVNSLGDDGVAGGRPLEIDVNVGTGSVEVRRG